MTTPGFTGVHHVTIPVSDLQADITWFENCLAAERLPRFDHHDQDGAVFAVILELPGSGPLVELRLDPAVAGAVAGYMPVAFGVRDRDELDRWISHLESHNIEHSAVAIRRVGHSMDVKTRDGLLLRFYTDPAGGFASVEFIE